MQRKELVGTGMVEVYNNQHLWNNRLISLGIILSCCVAYYCLCLSTNAVLLRLPRQYSGHCLSGDIQDRHQLYEGNNLFRYQLIFVHYRRLSHDRLRKSGGLAPKVFLKKIELLELSRFSACICWCTI